MTKARVFLTLSAATVLAVVGAGWVLAQSGGTQASDPLQAHTPEAVSKKGKDCFNGKCTGCEDCSKSSTVTLCKACCVHNCLGNGALDCQDLCATKVPLRIEHLRDDEAATGALLLLSSDRAKNGAAFTELDFTIVEWISAVSPHAAIRNLGIAVMADAWHKGLLQPESEPLFVEVFEAVLVGDDYDTRDTALILIVGDGIVPPVNKARVAPFLAKIAESGDDLNQAIARARPDKDAEYIDELADRHRAVARKAIAEILKQ